VRIERLGEATLYLGDCLEVLPTLGPVDALITDPPYSSGGQFRGDRNQRTALKYVQTDSDVTCRVDFSGDNRDQRAFLAWATMWFSRSLAIARRGAIVLVFTDWRQLPTMTDALQCGGWVWRNLITWWKPGIRMQRGRPSSSAEYILYGSHGVPVEGEDSPQNVLQAPPVAGDEKLHIAEKPVDLLEKLVGLTLPGAVVVDPFMGSGVTGIACAARGRRFIGIELDPLSFEIACERIRKAPQPRLPLEEPIPAPIQGELC